MNESTGFTEEEFARARDAMVDYQLAARDIRAPAVLQAFRRVPRHLFVPHEHFENAYADCALPIGYDQTISQPYMIARMLEVVLPAAGEHALEVGTGRGYQAALLWELTHDVHTVERIGALAEQARRHLAAAGYPFVHVHHADGNEGLAIYAPYEVILVAAGAATVPMPLLEQLAPGGRLAIPVGEQSHMTIRVIRREAAGFVETVGDPCVFVPLLSGTRH